MDVQADWVVQVRDKLGTRDFRIKPCAFLSGAEKKPRLISSRADRSSQGAMCFSILRSSTQHETLCLARCQRP